VCVHARARVRVCVHAHICECVHACVRVRHPFSYDTRVLTPYLMYFMLCFYHSHFISWIGSVILIIVSSFSFYPLYCLPGDGCVIGQNMYEVIIYQNYCTSLHCCTVHAVSISSLLFQLTHFTTLQNTKISH
jgi:hypothetical protein